MATIVTYGKARVGGSVIVTPHDRPRGREPSTVSRVSKATKHGFVGLAEIETAG